MLNRGSTFEGVDTDNFKRDDKFFRNNMKRQGVDVSIHKDPDGDKLWIKKKGT